MLFKKILLVFVLICKNSYGVLYSLNDTQYVRMPPLFVLDDYDECLRKDDGKYCVVDAELFTDEPSELMDLIKNYSEHTIKHFNHTQIHRGICITESCKKYTNLETTEDPKYTLEACLNESLWNEYELQTKSVNVLYCETKDNYDKIDRYDVIVAVIYVILLTLNVAGSYYDMRLQRQNNANGNPYILSFSVFRNWSRLTAPSGEGPDPRLERLKLFNGLRTMTIICVFFSHTVLIMAYSFVDNPLYIEKSYEDPLKQILFNGSLVVFTFFTMSSFLLAYNLEIYAEKQPITWSQLPKGIMQRWLRLTPSYALVIATISTWMRHLGGGPLWRAVVTSEATACRQYWWAHLLYINNYVYDDVFCFPQSWYLAADTQLFCLGFVICICARNKRTRKYILGSMLLLSLVIPAVQTYWEDLDAVVMQTPENYRNLYANYSTFRHLYVSAHANLATYIMGLSGGFLAYHYQSTGKDLTPYKKYKWLYWCVFPAGVGVILSGGLFYADGARAHVVWRVLYGSLYKPIFQFLVILIVLGAIFQIESVYRSVVEWRGWSWTGRLSYAGFLLHSTFQRGLVGSQRQPTRLTDYYVLMTLGATIFMTFLVAGIFWLLVEAPLCRLVKVVLEPKSREGRQLEKNVSLATVETIDLRSKL